MWDKSDRSNAHFTREIRQRRPHVGHIRQLRYAFHQFDHARQIDRSQMNII